MQRVIVLGGYGTFGARVAERLARAGGIEVVIAGRSRGRAESTAARLTRAGGVNVTASALDATTATARDLDALGASVLINASGPFQVQDYRVARACIAAGIHYLDLADARAFVTGISALDEEARRAGVLVVSGASTVPAVSGAALDAYTPQLTTLSMVNIVIAPGNSFEPGLATTQSILGTLGRPFAAPGKAAGARSYGWQGLRRRNLPGLGARWMGLCDAPDLDLFPGRYPGLASVKVYAALEVGAIHLGLWGLSWLVRGGLVRKPERLAAPLLGVKRRLGFLGSNRGGMVVTLEGADHAGRPKRIDWHFVAGSGHGPFVPATPAVLLAKRLLAGTLAARGAMPCLGLFTLADLLDEIADLDIAAGTT